MTSFFRDLVFGSAILALVQSKWVLITGASRGIGCELSGLFAADGFNLVLVARNEERLKAVAADLRNRHGIEAEIFSADLLDPNAPREIFDRLEKKQIAISILINNAGFACQGAFVKNDLEKHLSVIQLNISALVTLTRLFLPPMLARGEGRIMNVASTAAFLPGPYMAVYYATKAFVHSFSNAIAEEAAGSGVTVTTLYPGPTKTEFFDRAGMKRPESMSMEVARVAEAAYRGLMRGRRMIVPGLINKLCHLGCRLTPTLLPVKVSRRLNQ